MLRPHDNFMLIRLALALAVVVSHAFSVTTGRVEDEPLHALTGFTLGEHAVNGFFAVSGFLVTMSFLRRGWRDYAVARALRIGPGLIAATLSTRSHTDEPPRDGSIIGNEGRARLQQTSGRACEDDVATAGVGRAQPLSKTPTADDGRARPVPKLGLG